MAEFKGLNGFTVKDEMARNIAKGRNQAVAYSDYADMIEALNVMDNDQFRTGQNIYIGTVGVPDLWVYSVEPIRHDFNYVSDENVVELLQNNITIQCGFYKLAMLEGQKVDLTSINQKLEEHDTKLEEHNAKLEEHEVKLEEHQNSIEKLKNDIDGLVAVFSVTHPVNLTIPANSSATAELSRALISENIPEGYKRVEDVVLSYLTSSGSVGVYRTYVNNLKTADLVRMYNYSGIEVKVESVICTYLAIKKID